MAYFMIGRQVYDIKAERIKIGRVAEKNDMVIADMLASREHATLSLAGIDQFKLIDLGSSNGTYVKGQLIPPQTAYWLRSGDTVLIGNTTLTFWIGSPECIA